MRSRYSAFVAGEPSYLLRTWHPATRPETLELDDDVRWTGLEVLATEAGGPDDRRGTVEFVAHHLVAGRPGALHELSRFRRDAEGWRYVRGVLDPSGEMSTRRHTPDRQPDPGTPRA